MRQADLAPAAGAPLTTVRRFEAGRNVGLDALVNIALGLRGERELLGVFTVLRAGSIDDTLPMIVELGREHGITAAGSRGTIERTIDAVNRFEEFARAYPMSSSTLRDVNRALQSHIFRLTRRRR